jgi:hypothetical protein
MIARPLNDESRWFGGYATYGDWMDDRLIEACEDDYAAYLLKKAAMRQAGKRRHRRAALRARRLLADTDRMEVQVQTPMRAKSLYMMYLALRYSPLHPDDMLPF